jgi:hypothetical protein
MARNAKSELKTGSRGAYLWLTASHGRLDSVLVACPQAVLYKYLAITSLDSGSVKLNEEEKQLGWENRNGIAYSPKIQSIEKLPHESYDEWYVFKASTDIGELQQRNAFEGPLQQGNLAIFVNFGGFSLQDPVMQDLADLFWRQLEAIRPESYIADGDFLNFVTCNRELFEIVRAAFIARTSQD